MSVDLLYPDNRNRGNRVKQLLTQICTIQLQTKLNKNEVSEQLKTIETKIPDVLHQHNLQSLDELKQKLKDSLPEDVKKQYLELVECYDNQNADDTQILDVIGVIIMLGSVAGLGAKTVQIVTSGKIASAMNYVVRALIAVTTDVKRAQDLLKMGSVILKSLSKEIELGETAMKTVKFVKAAGTVIAILGVFIDAIFLVIAAIKGAEQRRNLEDAIHDLCFRRLSTQGISAMGEVYAQYISSMYTVVIKMKRGSKITEITDIIDEMCDDLTKGLKNITFESTIDALNELDGNDQATWKDKDPSLAELKEWWKDGKDPTIYKGPIPDKHLHEEKN